MNAMREAIEGTRLADTTVEVSVRFAIHPHHEQEPYHLPHQALWFVLMLLALFLLAGKKVAALQCVMA
jgi:hypothetical protein